MTAGRASQIGRWPANVILDETAAAALDQMTGTTSTTGKRSQRSQDATVEGTAWGTDNHQSTEYPGESGGASRFFYCAKASRSERGEGNTHPTVKPLKLVEYLARLILPPGRDTPRRLLVPFAGSGSEMIGGLRAGWDEVIGIEKSPGYVKIAKRRIAKQSKNTPP